MDEERLFMGTFRKDTKYVEIKFGGDQILYN